MNGDGSATIVTGAQENGSGAVMAMPVFVGQELGIDPKDVSMLYQDTDVAPWDMGSCGSQTTFNSGRAILAAAAEVREQLLDAAAAQLEADRGDIELADGTARVKGSPDRSVAMADLVGEIGTVHGKGFRRRAGGADRRHGRLRRAYRQRDVPRAQLITQAAHVKVDRETGVVRVLRVAAAHDSRAGSSTRPARPGLRRRRDGRRPRSPRARCSTTRATSGTRTCSTTSWSPARTPRRSRSSGSSTASGRPSRLKGRRRAAAGTNRRGDRERDRQGARAARCGGCR